MEPNDLKHGYFYGVFSNKKEYEHHLQTQTKYSLCGAVQWAGSGAFWSASVMPMGWQSRVLLSCWCPDAVKPKDKAGTGFKPPRITVVERFICYISLVWSFGGVTTGAECLLRGCALWSLAHGDVQSFRACGDDELCVLGNAHFPSVWGCSALGLPRSPLKSTVLIIYCCFSQRQLSWLEVWYIGGCRNWKKLLYFISSSYVHASPALQLLEQQWMVFYKWDDLVVVMYFLQSRRVATEKTI